jgi:hypothetical protein
MYMRDTGLAVSLIAGAMVGVGYFIGWVSTRGYLSGPPELSARGSKWSKKELLGFPVDEHLHQFWLMLGGASAISLSIGVFGGLFCFLFAILNPLMQLEELTREEIERQLADGTLILRLSTIVFAGLMLWRSASCVGERARSSQPRRNASRRI